MLFDSGEACIVKEEGPEYALPPGPNPKDGHFEFAGLLLSPRNHF